jgi:hypothetical protein
VPKLPFFNGDFYTLDDRGSESSQLINVFPEVIESGTGKAVGRFVGTPGLQVFLVIGSGATRALWMGEGRMFCVSGSVLYEVFADTATQVMGDIGDDDEHTPVQIFVNGNDLLVISAGFAYRVWVDIDGVTVHTDKIKLIAAEYTDLAIAVKAFLFDLEIDAADDTKVTSATRPFVAGDIGLNLQIESGTDFTPGTYAISSVAGGAATLGGACGLVGATGGVGEIVDPMAEDQLSSPTLPFIAADVGATVVIDPASPAGFGGGGTYRVVSVTDGIATMDTWVGAAGTLGGIAVEYPGESPSTDADGHLRAGSGAYLDGYGIIAPPPAPKILTNVYYISEQGNFARWSALDKGTKEGYPDNILALLADHQELIVFGDLQSTEVHRDTGAANFPFERDMGAFMHYGLAAKDSVSQLGLNGIAWLGWSSGRGQPQAFYAAGFQPQRISTSMLEHLWDEYPSVRDARAFSYVEDGHHFWVITFPSADISWCYDLTASQQMGKPMWHARGTWDGDKWHRIRANCHTYGYFRDDPDHKAATWTRGLTHFVGDWEKGIIYIQGLYNYDEFGHPIRRQMVSSHLANDNKRTVWHLFQMECLVGDGANDLTWTLDYSRDRGYTFRNARQRTAPGGGKRNQRLRWLRCGQSFDQTWRLITDSAAKISVTSMWFEADPSKS